jgi:dihydroorotate dehydrogenase (NAD+) catalytic subunit
MKFDLAFTPPFMNAAGSLGYAPDPHGPVELARLGAFVTNPISMERRTPAHAVRYAEYPGGFLLHNGHPNAGFNVVLRRYAPVWRRSPLPVIVHLLPAHPDEAARMARRLEGLPGVGGVEIGLPPEAEPGAAVEMARAAAGELPVVLRLPLGRAEALAAAVAADRVGAGVAAFSLGPPRGVLPIAGGAFASGRLYGPGIFPLALAAVQAMAAAGLPVIAAGGIYSSDQAQAMLAAGALAVQLDTVLWRGEFIFE